MCLTTLDGRSKIADHDIVCFKALEYLDGKLTSPFYKGCRWEVGRKKTNRHPIPSIRGIVRGGHYHAYKNCKDALRSKGLREHWKIYKAIIPKGTKYFEGIDSNGVSGYASKSLKLWEEVV